MITDLQNWCKEAKVQGTSARSWSDLKQVYMVPNMTEESLRDQLKTFALNNHLTITFEKDSDDFSLKGEIAILCGK